MENKLASSESGGGISDQALNGVEQLLEALSRGHLSQAEDALRKLGAEQESTLYQRVGELTRTLHNALSDFRRSLDSSSVTMHSTNIPDAANKIEAVMRMTQKSAETTLECVEEQSDIVRKALEELHELEGRFKSASPPSVQALQLYLSSLTPRIARLGDLGDQVLMAQSFQDLTGQSLQKVLRLVSELEKSLIGLVEFFGAPAAPEPPPEEEAPSGQMNQDEVDDVLSKFGF